MTARPPSGAGFLSFAKVRAFMLDEYVGLPADHPQRYRNVIQAEFVDKVDIDPARCWAGRTEPGQRV